MTPKLADGVKMSGDILVRLVGQGCIYVRTLLPVTNEDDDEEEDTDLLVNPFDREEKIEETSEGSISSMNEQPSLIIDANVLGAEVEVIADGNVNEQPNFTEHSIVGLQREINPSAEVQVIDIVPVDDVPQDEVQIDEPVRCIRVHRASVREDMLDIFSDQSIMFAPLQVTLVNTFGRDEEGLGSGPSREVFALFWKEAYNSLLLGEQERVPYIRHDYTREKWEAIARILVKGFTEVSYFPFMFSKPFLASCLYGEKSVDERMLIDSFMQYVSRDEASLINKALAHEVSLDDEEFLDFLTNFDCKRRVTELNLREIILELAHKELIQKPQYVINCWKPVLSKLKCYFPNPEALLDHYKVVIPTTSKVISLLKADPSTPSEMETFSNFKRYIRGLDSTKLGAFLRFCTGSDTLITDRLDIAFTQSAGVGRVPVAHTCGFTLELPATYENLCAMREEFNNILSADNWEMNFV